LILKINVLFFLFAIPVIGLYQNIQRKGSLGVGYYLITPDSLIKILQYKSGVVKKFITPNSTATA
jgi:hypothetical protein